MKKTGRNKNCLNCQREFYVSEWRLKDTKRGKFCSRKCSDKSKIGKFTWNKGQFQKGFKHTEEFKKMISERLKGKPTWNTGIKGYTNNGSFKSGELSLKWKGGITTENEQIRKTFEYRTWRRLIFKRDNYECQICGNGHNRVIRANHIKRFADYPDLRLELTNGITICRDCDYQWVLNHEEEWENYFNFNLETRGVII